MRSIAVWVTLLLAGCSSSSESTTTDASTTTDSSTTDSSSTDDTSSDAVTPSDSSEDTAGACNSLANDAPEITGMSSSAMFPSGLGGTVVDGTYFLTAETVYGSSGGGTNKETIAIAAGTIQIVKLGVTNPIDRTSWTYTAGSTSLSLTRTCPSPKNQSLGFTASGATLKTYDSLSKIEKVYTKQ